MPNAKVNQRSKSYPVREEHSENRNWFNLSHDWKATFTMGKLIPFFWDETMPNDYYKINAEVLMRFAPLYLPILHRVNLSMDWWFVPYRIAWTYQYEGENSKGWENFIMNKESQLLNPYVIYTAEDYTYGSAGELPMYMGVPTLIEEELPQTLTMHINALPLAIYYMIYDQGYRNDQVQAPILAEQNLVNGATGDTTFPDPAYSLSCMYRNWNRDLYTMCTFEPQQGVGVNLPLVADDYHDDILDLDYNGPFRWRKQTNDAPAAASTSVQIGSGGFSASSADTAKIYLDINETAPSIAQFRFAVIYQEFLERALRTGDRISDYYPNFWHTDPYNGTLQLPIFLGAKKGRVTISEVMSTTQTETLKVGNYAGQALAVDSTHDTIEYHCLEHGVVMGIVSVYPDSSYFQGLDPVWTRSTYLDYPDPRFALIGDEEVLNQEVQYAFQTALLPRNTETFAYRERFATKRFKNDVVAGYFRTFLNSFHLGRLFNPTDPENLTTGSVFNTTFLYCKPRITDVFQVVAGEDEIYCHIFNDVKVQRMLPKFGIPAV